MPVNIASPSRAFSEDGKLGALMSPPQSQVLKPTHCSQFIGVHGLGPLFQCSWVGLTPRPYTGVVVTPMRTLPVCSLLMNPQVLHPKQPLHGQEWLEKVLSTQPGYKMISKGKAGPASSFWAHLSPRYGPVKLPGNLKEWNLSPSLKAAGMPEGPRSPRLGSGF